MTAAKALDAALIAHGALENPELAGDTAAGAASKVAAIPEVRQVLLAFQQHFAANPPPGAAGSVLDGRDTGTVVCPNAPVKFFITASAEVRAQRRHKELLERGETSIHPRVLADMKERDVRDSTRAISAPEGRRRRTNHRYLGTGCRRSAFAAALEYIGEYIASVS